MLDTYTDNNINDFQARYLGTYGWMVNGDKKQFVYLADANDDLLYFNKGRGATFNVKVNSGVYFEFIPIDRGWYDSVGENVYYLERRPQRQWKRGISNGNTRVLRLDVGTYTDEVSYVILNSIFNQPQTYDKFKVNNRGALSKHFAVDHVGNLYFYLEKIGAFDGKVFHLNNNLVQQELVDTLRRRQYNFEVVVVE